MATLQEKWHSLASAYFSNHKQVSLQFQRLRTCYEESHRQYHNLNHIHTMLLKAESVASHWEAADLVYFAIWFHDVIYDAKRSDNEQKSAELAVHVLSQHSRLTSNQIQRVEQLILATTKHIPLQEHQDFYLFLDIDLAILGESWETYQTYATAIRQEYQHVPWEMYQTGRKQILERFLEREQIYYSSLFRDVYEEQARMNIQREISGIIPTIL